MRRAMTALAARTTMGVVGGTHYIWPGAICGRRDNREHTVVVDVAYNGIVSDSFFDPPVQVLRTKQKQSLQKRFNDWMPPWAIWNGGVVLDFEVCIHWISIQIIVYYWPETTIKTPGRDTWQTFKVLSLDVCIWQPWLLRASCPEPQPRAIHASSVYKMQSNDFCCCCRYFFVFNVCLRKVSP